jgi:hypothetical protein
MLFQFRENVVGVLWMYLKRMCGMESKGNFCFFGDLPAGFHAIGLWGFKKLKMKIQWERAEAKENFQVVDGGRACRGANFFGA